MNREISHPFRLASLLAALAMPVALAAGTEEAPNTEEPAPAVETVPAGDAAPADEDSPAEEAKPAEEVPAAEEAMPPADGSLIEEVSPMPDGTPADGAPLIDESTLVEESPMPDETPPAGETPPEEETPQEDEKPAGDWEFSLGGQASIEMLAFPQTAADPRQENIDFSVALEPELKWKNKEKGLTFTFTPFGRYDTGDHVRTHGDLREFSIKKEFENSDLLVGVGKVFWGATESVHWVDVINQTDLIEDIDGEAKLGQPMINYNQFTDYGRISMFVLPGFRERTFPGIHGRLRTIPRVVETDGIYESGAEQGHVDFAVRWSKAFGDIDVGVSWFHGTTREPVYLPKVISTGEVILQPYYEIIDQIGTDATWTVGDWLLKNEVMIRSGQTPETFFRAATGFEYTLFKVLDSGVDVGLITEYLYDSQGNNPINPYENDIAYGARITFNDIHDTTLLVTAITDTRDASTTFNLEANMRFGEHWIVSAIGRAFAGVPADDFPLNGFRRDSYVQAALEYHF